MHALNGEGLCCGVMIVACGGAMNGYSATFGQRQLFAADDTLTISASGAGVPFRWSEPIAVPKRWRAPLIQALLFEDIRLGSQSTPAPPVLLEAE